MSTDDDKQTSEQETRNRPKIVDMPGPESVLEGMTFDRDEAPGDADEDHAESASDDQA